MCLSTRIEGLNVPFGESGVRHGACVLSVTGSHGNGREAAARLCRGSEHALASARAALLLGARAPHGSFCPVLAASLRPRHRA